MVTGQLRLDADYLVASATWASRRPRITGRSTPRFSKSAAGSASTAEVTRMQWSTLVKLGADRAGRLSR